MIDRISGHPIWKYFYEITQIPRPSEKEQKILFYLTGFAEKHRLRYQSDAVDNLIISKKASSGMETRQPVILQSHVDMVCEKNLETAFDFDKDAIKAYVDGDWIRAEGTTLGADDGIGIATQLAILADPEIRHGPIECLFTVDEESGMTGAKGLEPGILKGGILINLDSEDEGELFIGCAGGMDTTALYRPEWIPVPDGHSAFKVVVDGLRGGHSGDEIHKGLGNSVKILNRFLTAASKEFGVGISHFEGGNLRNAIPRESFAVLSIDPSEETGLTSLVKSFSETVKNEIKAVDPDFKITVIRMAVPEKVLDAGFASGLLNSIDICPHGELAMSKEIEGLVETSTNLAAIKFEGEKIKITTSQRSSTESAKNAAAKKVREAFESSGADVSHSGGYPGWTPDTESKILKLTRSSYQKLFGKQPVVKAIHAGLECGLFLKKYPGLDMISFGPTIRGAHSPDERLNIPGTYKFWDLLIEVLKNIPDLD